MTQYENCNCRKSGFYSEGGIITTYVKGIDRVKSVYNLHQISKFKKIWLSWIYKRVFKTTDKQIRQEIIGTKTLN